MSLYPGRDHPATNRHPHPWRRRITSTRHEGAGQTAVSRILRKALYEYADAISMRPDVTPDSAGDELLGYLHELDPRSLSSLCFVGGCYFRRVQSRARSRARSR
jgi:hypothetical protein